MRLLSRRRRFLGDVLRQPGDVAPSLGMGGFGRLLPRRLAGVAARGPSAGDGAVGAGLCRSVPGLLWCVGFGHAVADAGFGVDVGGVVGVVCEFSAAAGEPKELWLIPGAEHREGATAAPDEYRRRIVAFFDDNL